MITVQDLLCMRCGDKYAEQKVPDGKTVTKKQIKTRKLCKACLEESKRKAKQRLIERNQSPKLRKLNSHRLTCDNPMFDVSTAKKVSNKLILGYENGTIKSSFDRPEVKRKAIKSVRTYWSSSRCFGWLNELSRRMKQKNPMHDPATVQKVHENLKKQRESGKLTYPRGKNHWLWKGNRSFNLFVRARLYEVWIRPILERDLFVCQVCGEHKNKLHVHHLKPLELIIHEVLEANNVDDIEQLKQTPRYSELADIIVEAHEMSMGITVCKKCHGRIDDKYKGKEND